MRYALVLRGFEYVVRYKYIIIISCYRCISILNAPWELYSGCSQGASSSAKSVVGNGCGLCSWIYQYIIRVYYRLLFERARIKQLTVNAKHFRQSLCVEAQLIAQLQRMVVGEHIMFGAMLAPWLAAIICAYSFGLMSFLNPCGLPKLTWSLSFEKSISTSGFSLDTFIMAAWLAFTANWYCLA